MASFSSGNFRLPLSQTVVLTFEAVTGEVRDLLMDIAADYGLDVTHKAIAPVTYPTHYTCAYYNAAEARVFVTESAYVLPYMATEASVCHSFFKDHENPSQRRAVRHIEGLLEEALLATGEWTRPIEPSDNPPEV